MTEIYVIRHVQAEGNLYRHMQGHWDGDVTPVGRRQRDALARRFKDIPVDAVYSSDLWRARFTASAITATHDLPVRLDPRLREIHVGPWETRPFANVIWETPALFETFIHDPEHFFLEGAETFHQVQDRAVEALYEIAEQNPGRTVVITTHGVAIRCMLTKLLGVSLNDTETVPIFHNTGIAHLLYEDGRFTVDTINDAAHLPPELLRRAQNTPVLRDVCADPAQVRALYEDCYADAWRAAHGNLRGFEADVYFLSACDHYRRDPESIRLLYEGETFAGLLDLDTARGEHAGYGWISLLYEGEEFAGLLDLDTARGEHAGYGWISLLYLRPEYRGRGLGVQLLGRAVSMYRRLGRRSIRLNVAEDNAMALAFYRANGFTELSRVPGSGAELLLMEKGLGRLGDGTV